jgi:CheY-like chemotaxis protein
LGKNLKTLIVDDEHSIRQIIKYLLQDFGQTETVANGEEAIRCFVQAW